MADVARHRVVTFRMSFGIKATEYRCRYQRRFLGAMTEFAVLPDCSMVHPMATSGPADALQPVEASIDLMPRCGFTIKAFPDVDPSFAPARPERHITDAPALG